MPEKQTILNYIYTLSGGSIKRSNVSNEPLTISIDVEYDEKYTFEVQV